MGNEFQPLRLLFRSGGEAMTLYEAWAHRWRWVYYQGGIRRVRLSNRPGMMVLDGGELAPMGAACRAIRGKWVQCARYAMEDGINPGLFLN